MPCPVHAQRFAPGAAAHARWYGRNVDGRQTEPEMSFVSPACSLCSGMQRNGSGGNGTFFITVTRLRIDLFEPPVMVRLLGATATAVAKSELVTYVYGVSTFGY